MSDASLTADPGVASSIPAWSHTFVEIDHKIISTVILLPSAESFKKGCCQLLAKVCARSTGYSPSYTVTIQAPIHHDSSRFETDGKIGLHRDASEWKKRNSSINTMSNDASTVSARFIYGPTTTQQGALRFTTVELRMLTNAHYSIRCWYDSSR